TNTVNDEAPAKLPNGIGDQEDTTQRTFNRPVIDAQILKKRLVRQQDVDV
ncbi:unnamed protein product, partial [marine sediment metagenome]